MKKIMGQFRITGHITITEEGGICDSSLGDLSNFEHDFEFISDDGQIYTVDDAAHHEIISSKFPNYHE